MKLMTQIKSYDDNFFRHMINFNNNTENTELSEASRNLARKFSSNAFSNLDNWPYLYFTAGITEAINYFVLSKPTYAQESDYRYLKTLPILKTLSNNDQYYFSYPYAGNGKFLEIPKNKNLILDCSYIFASNLKCNTEVPDNVDYILFGVSKSHNLSNLRSGWFFSKKKIQSFHVMQYDYNYLGIIHKKILETISLYECNHFYKKFHKEFSQLYKENNLHENDTNLFAMLNDQKIPYYTLLK